VTIFEFCHHSIIKNKYVKISSYAGDHIYGRRKPRRWKSDQAKKSKRRVAAQTLRGQKIFPILPSCPTPFLFIDW
jgi:hypothetical protein